MISFHPREEEKKICGRKERRRMNEQQIVRRRGICFHIFVNGNCVVNE
jgi:hypothetical protein